MKFIDLTGQRFGRLEILERGETRRKRTFWKCRCGCGTVKDIQAGGLKRRDKYRTLSCGCLGAEHRRAAAIRHGKSKSPEYMMRWEAHKRAKARGLPFDITPDDIVIPDRCPLLDIPLFKKGDAKHPIARLLTASTLPRGMSRAMSK